MRRENQLPGAFEDCLVQWRPEHRVSPRTQTIQVTRRKKVPFAVLFIEQKAPTARQLRVHQRLMAEVLKKRTREAAMINCDGADIHGKGTFT
ncbi:unnamed protein product [Mesocestoides corti]|uniref:Transposase n=1 Tax=Mesocestoides corti TaxID=53468 RepID=A0A0R3U5R7_MESCO|nr:unnamed protein product [Mesocestoides corti]